MIVKIFLMKSNCIWNESFLNNKCALESQQIFFKMAAQCPNFTQVSYLPLAGASIIKIVLCLSVYILLLLLSVQCLFIFSYVFFHHGTEKIEWILKSSLSIPPRSPYYCVLSSTHPHPLLITDHIHVMNDTYFSTDLMKILFSHAHRLSYSHYSSQWSSVRLKQTKGPKQK